jgi:hypothetical protein
MRQFNTLLVLLDIKALEFTESDPSKMKFEARKFRRELYGKIDKESKDSGVPLNTTFLPALRDRHKLRSKSYKKGIGLSEEDLIALFDQDLDTLEDSSVENKPDIDDV